MTTLNRFTNGDQDYINKHNQNAATTEAQLNDHESRIGNNETAIAGLGGSSAAAILKVPSWAAWRGRVKHFRELFAGSGFVEWGQHLTSNLVNQGIWRSTSAANTLSFGRDDSSAGSSRTKYPLANVNGILLRLEGAGSTGAFQNNVILPAAANDSSLLGRTDLVFLEVWEEKVSDKDIVFPYGNAQWASTSWNGISLSAPISAAYSAFGAFQDSPGSGRGLVWSTAEPEEQQAFLDEPLNNLFARDGVMFQVRYRFRTLAGLGDSWGTLSPNQGGASDVFGYDSSNRCQAQGSLLSIASDLVSAAAYVGYNTAAGQGIADGGTRDRGAFLNRNDGTVHADGGTYAGTTETFGFALPICLVERLNQGAFHPDHNPRGAAKFLNTDGSTAAFWYETDQTISNAEDTFTHATGGSQSSGVSGRPDGNFYDRFVAPDIVDIRTDANRVPDWSRLLEKLRTDLLTNSYNSHRKVLTSETAATGAELSRMATTVHFGVDAGAQIAVTLNADNTVTHAGSASTVVYYGALELQGASSSITDWLTKGQQVADTDDKAASMLIEKAHSDIQTGSTTDLIALTKEADSGVLTLAAAAAQAYQFAFGIGRKNGKAYAVVNYDSAGALDRTARKLEFELPQFALEVD